MLRQVVGTQARAFLAGLEDALATGDDRVIEAEGRPVGRVVCRGDETELRIVDITVAPDARSMGVGSTALTSLAAAGVDDGKAVTLSVVRTNRARHLYERLGFVEIDGDDVRAIMRYEPPN